MKENLVRDKAFEFALLVIALSRRLYAEREYVLSKQLVRSGTSIGANVEEALAGQSRNDFISKMTIASKEAREAHYWLRLLQASKITQVDLSRELVCAEELVRLLTSIVKTTTERKQSIQN